MSRVGWFKLFYMLLRCTIYSERLVTDLLQTIKHTPEAQLLWLTVVVLDNPSHSNALALQTGMSEQWARILQPRSVLMESSPLAWDSTHAHSGC